MIAIAKTSIVKKHPKALRENRLHKEPLPVEMLPNTNRICGKWGHDWEVIGNRKRCRRHLCEVTRAYKPNEFKRSEKHGGMYSVHCKVD